MLIRPEEWRPQGVDDLEERAWDALRENDRSVCVTAGAGAGKTEFLAQKAAYLLETGLCSTPKRILAISFKRDAAETLSQRVKKRCKAPQARRFDSVTFDSFTKRIVDQFRKAIPEAYRPPRDYEITFPSAPAFREFMQRHEIHGINDKQMENLVARMPIAQELRNIDENLSSAVRLYWQDQIRGPGQTYVTFDMLNRLAEYLLRTNIQVRRALRQTYPFVFLDEFQDATYSQWGMLKTAFEVRTTKFTAVGDDKQRIMGWAGAMPNAFARFTQVVNARSVTLLSNWRSHDDLVEVQHAVAQRINPDVEQVVARRERQVDGHISAIWVFNNRDQEIDTLAEWISREINHGMLPDQFAILVRMSANNVEIELAQAFLDRGIKIRNLARNVGGVAIQDTLVEPLTEIVLPFLRLGAVIRDRVAWTTATEKLKSLEGISEEDDLLLQQANAKADRIIRETRRYMLDHPSAPELAGELVATIVDQIGENKIRRSVAAYSRDSDYARIYGGLTALLAECLDNAENWEHALDLFAGKNQLALMTVHKSKGMEFHTVIFFGLDSRTWRSLRPDNLEELNTFFVALTRAEQRAFFTFCEARGNPIDWLEEILGERVPRVRGLELLDG
jgi:superfamily I DNA/RNA helicase